MTVDVVLATRNEKLRENFGSVLAERAVGFTQATSATALRECLFTTLSRVAVVDLNLPGITGKWLLETKVNSREEPSFVLLFDEVKDIMKIKDLPPASVKTIMWPIVNWSKGEMEKLAENVVELASPGPARHMHQAIYDGRRKEFVVYFRNGQSFRLPRSVIPDDDGSDVIRVNVVPNGTLFTYALSSGQKVEIPWDLVLYHSDPSYPYYKRRGGQKKLERSLGIRIGRRVRRIRGEKGLTTEALARLTGIHRPNISRIERGTHTPNFDTIGRLAKGLGVSLTDLVDSDRRRSA